MDQPCPACAKLEFLEIDKHDQGTAVARAILVQLASARCRVSTVHSIAELRDQERVSMNLPVSCMSWRTMANKEAVDNAVTLGLTRDVT